MVDVEGSRRLRAILAADVAGYSRLMQVDDRATVATLEAYRVVFREHIEAHEGRIVDMAGDTYSPYSIVRRKRCELRWIFRLHWLSAMNRCPRSGGCAFGSV